VQRADASVGAGQQTLDDLFDWFQDVAITSSGLGLTDVSYKRNHDIVQQDRDGVTLRRWSPSRAWPNKFVAGEWDNESDENVIEQVTLTYDFFELVQ
jgi:phage tail-like protein